MTNKIPNPGSDKALKQGCKCPILDNGHGIQSMYGVGKWVYNLDCPLHASVFKSVK